MNNVKGPEIELDFNTQTTSLTKQIEFEPPVASTRNLRPILNKLNQFDLSNKLHTIIDDSFELSLDKVNEDDKESEKEKLLNAHLNNLGKNSKLEQMNSNEKLFSKMISDDCITSTSKWGLVSNSGGISSEIRKDVNMTTKQVKFQLISDDKTEVISSATKRNITSSQTTQVGVIGCISWDYDYLEIGKDIRKTNKHIDIEVDQTCKIIDECELMQPTPQKNNISVPLPINDDTNNVEEAELLTNEKLEKTFNQDYYKLFHNDMFGVENQSLFDINQPTQNTNLNISKLIGLKQITEFNEIEKLDFQNADLAHKTVNDTLNKIDYESNKLNLPNITLNGELIKDDNLVNNLTLVSEADTTCLGKSDNNSSIMTGATTTHLNETIINALRDPFSFEVKNRLINRGALDYLKKNPNYVSLRTNIPMIKEKINVSLKDGFTYKVIKEIGKGAYAKIYLIENRENKSSQQFALKVNSSKTESLFNKFLY